ncbi:MAG: hypothetical protein QOF76_942 [Solirubrobacteraceae bacterium]|nr:hypothetical protein [Solirubrobacteraceae bacterium]
MIEFSGRFGSFVKSTAKPPSGPMLIVPPAVIWITPASALANATRRKSWVRYTEPVPGPSRLSASTEPMRLESGQARAASAIGWQRAGRNCSLNPNAFGNASDTELTAVCPETGVTLATIAGVAFGACVEKVIATSGAKATSETVPCSRMRGLALVTAGVIAVAAAPASASHGTVKLTADNAFGLNLVQDGVDAAPIAPATQDSLTFTFPVARKPRHARVKSRGGLDMQDVEHGIDLQLVNLTFTVKGERVTASAVAKLGGVEQGRFIFASGQAQSLRTTRRKTSATVPLALTDIGSAALNSQFNVSDFATGALFGVAKIAAH